MREASPGTEAPRFEEVAPETWARLAGERIFFGHQSVGGNLLAGVQEVLAANREIPLRVVETTDAAAMAGPALYHAPIGRNGEPSSKLSHFRAVVESSTPGLALVKYCYVDVNRSTDAAALFEEYRRTVESMKLRLPGLTIVHITLPLRADPGTLRHVAARIRGLPSEREDNLIRHRYNELLRSAYGGREPLFDLARLESTAANGRPVAVHYAGARMPVLAREWTDDGGHLNGVGQRRMAEAFLATLAGVYSGAESTP